MDNEIPEDEYEDESYEDDYVDFKELSDKIDQAMNPIYTIDNKYTLNEMLKVPHMHNLLERLKRYLVKDGVQIIIKDNLTSSKEIMDDIAKLLSKDEIETIAERKDGYKQILYKIPSDILSEFGMSHGKEIWDLIYAEAANGKDIKSVNIVEFISKFDYAKHINNIIDFRAALARIGVELACRNRETEFPI